MIVWYNHITDTKQYRKDISGSCIRIGRGQSNDIVLPNPFVAEYAAVLNKCPQGWELQVLGFNGLQVSDTQLNGGDRHLLQHSEIIRIFPFDITLDLPKKEELSRREKINALTRQLSTFTSQLHVELLHRMNLDIQHLGTEEISEPHLISLEKHIEGIAKDFDFFDRDYSNLADHLAGLSVRDELLNSLSSGTRKAIVGILQDGRHWSRLLTAVRSYEEELIEMAKHFFNFMKVEKKKTIEEKFEYIERKFWDAWDRVLSKNGIREEFRHYAGLRYLKKNIKDILFGYGPLEDLLRLPTISEIMVVSSDKIFIEKGGRIENSGRRFISDEVTVTIVNRIASKVNRHIDKSVPLVDARLADGSRVNAVIAPLAVSGPTLTIRKFPETRLLAEDLVKMGALPRSAAEFLRATVLNRGNIIVSGGTGTGKTTLLNCLSDFIPDNERIVTIEDTAELRLNKEHLVRLETKDANIEGKGAYFIRDLVKNSLRMRPDRIIVGECRGAEALDMLQAMNTGHDGSMTTIHANTSSDVVLRLEVLVQMAADLPISSIHRQIVSAIDLVVQLKRMRNGRRCVSQISEITGIDPLDHTIVLKDIFLLENDVDDEAKLRPTGILPSYMDILIARGMMRLDAFYL